jgi:predicted nucleotidyltransferase
MLSDEDISRIAARIVVGYGPLVVGTFGSYAIGTAREGSDLDLFVIKETSESPAARRGAVQRILFGVLCPLDLHVFTAGEFEETVREELSFTWVIARQKRLYYWASEATQRVPSLVAKGGDPR